MSAKDTTYSQKLQLISKQVTGELAYHGERFVLGDDDSIKNISAYVMQKDVLLATETPEETLMFSANLRLGRDISDAAKQERVDRILESLKITECEDTLIGDENLRGISGGEQKRTSVGLELITDPSLVFLDEPTSGLDAFTAARTIALLSQMSKESGRHVIATLHQPSSEVMMTLDMLMLMAKGHSVYYGPPGEVVQYFENLGAKYGNDQNPADFILDEIQLNPQKYIDAWKKEEARRLLARPLNFDGYAPLVAGQIMRLKLMDQLKYVMQREARMLWRNPQTLKLRVSQTLAVSLLLGMMYWQMPRTQQGLRDRLGLCFFGPGVFGFIGVTSTLLTFPEQRLVFDRERNNNMYYTSVFFMAKFVLQTLEMSVLSLVGGIVIWAMADLDMEWWLFVLGMTITMNSFGANGMLLGCFADNNQQAIQLQPLGFQPLLMFSNFMVSLDNIPSFIRWFQWLDFLRYVVEAMAIGEFRGNHGYKVDKATGEGFEDGTAYLISLGFQRKKLVFDLFMTLVLFCAVRLITLLFLIAHNGW